MYPSLGGSQKWGLLPQGGVQAVPLVVTGEALGPFHWRVSPVHPAPYEGKGHGPFQKCPHDAGLCWVITNVPPRGRPQDRVPDEPQPDCSRAAHPLSPPLTPSGGRGPHPICGLGLTIVVL